MTEMTSSKNIGPGSRAWSFADDAAFHFANGNKNAAYCAQRRMIAALRSAGRTKAEIEIWKEDIRLSPIE